MYRILVGILMVTLLSACATQQPTVQAVTVEQQPAQVQVLHPDGSCDYYANKVIEPQHNIYTVEQERELGARMLSMKELAPQLDAGPLRDASIALLELIERRLRPLLPAYARDQVFSYRITPGSDALDARSVPGGTIIMSVGTLIAASDPNEVAVVQSHEMAHVVLRHGTRRATLELERERAVLKLVLENQQILDWPEHKMIAFMEERLGPALNMRLVSIEQETEAEIFAARVASAAGYDVTAIADIHEAKAGEEDALIATYGNHATRSTRALILRCFNTDTVAGHPEERALLETIKSLYRNNAP